MYPTPLPITPTFLHDYTSWRQNFKSIKRSQAPSLTCRGQSRLGVRYPVRVVLSGSLLEIRAAKSACREKWLMARRASLSAHPTHTLSPWGAAHSRFLCWMRDKWTGDSYLHFLILLLAVAAKTTMEFITGCNDALIRSEEWRQDHQFDSQWSVLYSSLLFSLQSCWHALPTRPVRLQVSV